MEDSTTEHLEHREHAEHAAHSNDPMLLKVSVTIAILAVVAATVGSLEATESGAALSRKSESVLLQNRATDRWSYYQAQSVKRHLYEIAAAANPAHATDYADKAKRYDDESTTTRKEAEAFEHDSERLLDEGERREHRHHVLTIGVTLIHVAIAVATLSIILRGKAWPWYVAIGLGAVGSLVAGVAYVV